ncbi:MAG: hypothetical protein ABJ275_02285 [Maricaulaceae bacterium]
MKKLNNLKTGVGASILSLTKAIEDTHKAAREAQTSTVQTVETLRHLLEKSESAAPKIEALILELEQASVQANTRRQELDGVVKTKLSPAINKAQLTASELLKIVSNIDQYKKSLPTPKPHHKNMQTDTIIKLKNVKRSAT